MGVTAIKSTRIQSIDTLRGIVMALMALDHVRDYFYLGSFTANDPTDLETTTPALFFTRFMTHFCAPVFVFLAGTSAYLYGNKKTRKELAVFLLTRGLWLMLLEVVLNNFIWWFDITYSFMLFQVIWAIGLSMVFLSFLIYLPYTVLLAIGIIITAGHNLLDAVSFNGTDLSAVIWYTLFQVKYLPMDSGQVFLFGYPTVPWLGIMILGYCMGRLYQKEFFPKRRRKTLLWLGLGGILTFVVLRSINSYGNPVPWSPQATNINTVLSFLNIEKYPPSLMFTLVTLGMALVFLSLLESRSGKLSAILLVFGRVPLFYYFLHVLVIHGAATLMLDWSGGNWKDFIMTAEAFSSGNLSTFGYPLASVYLIWVVLLLLLFPICYWYMKLKSKKRHLWWLRYL